MFNLEGGRNKQGRQILKASALDEAFKPQNSIPADSTDKFYTKPTTPVTMAIGNYGLGWKLGHYRGKGILGISMGRKYTL